MTFVKNKRILRTEQENAGPGGESCARPLAKKRGKRMNNGEKGFHAPARCPVCGQDMRVTKLRCGRCGTELSGEFSPCRFCSLEEKHLQFVETFLRCRGSIKEVEKALGVSYPTVKNMLEAALAALGLDETPELKAVRQDEERSEILTRLANKEIDVETAVEALNQLKGGK